MAVRLLATQTSPRRTVLQDDGDRSLLFVSPALAPQSYCFAHFDELRLPGSSRRTEPHNRCITLIVGQYAGDVPTPMLCLVLRRAPLRHICSC